LKASCCYHSRVERHSKYIDHDYDSMVSKTSHKSGGRSVI